MIFEKYKLTQSQLYTEVTLVITNYTTITILNRKKY